MNGHNPVYQQKHYQGHKHYNLTWHEDTKLDYTWHFTQGDFAHWESFLQAPLGQTEPKEIALKTLNLSQT